MLDGLAHTRLVIYPALTIHYQRVAIRDSPDSRFKGEIGSDLPSYHQTTKVTLTENSPERSGYMHMDKEVTHSILDMIFSMIGTKAAKVEACGSSTDLNTLYQNTQMAAQRFCGAVLL